MNEKMISFGEAVKPIQKWFRENCSPHDKIIIDWNMANLFEGSMGVTSGWIDFQSTRKDIKNVSLSICDGGNYFVDLQCGEEHLGQDCACRHVASTKSKEDAIWLADRMSKRLDIPLVTNI
jgi:hypothetical protein